MDETTDHYLSRVRQSQTDKHWAGERLSCLEHLSLFPVPMVGGSQLPMTPVPRESMPSSGLLGMPHSLITIEFRICLFEDR